MEKDTNTNQNIRLHVKSVRPIKDDPIERRRRGIIFLRPRHWTDDLLTQELLCTSFCEKNNIEVIEVHSYLGDRIVEPTEFESWGIGPVLEYCQSHKGELDVLVVMARDRLGTNTADYLKCKIDLLKEGVEIISVTDIEHTDSAMKEICKIVARYQKDAHGEEAEQIV